MEVNANRPRDRVNSQWRDLPLSVRIHLDAGRARVAKGAQAAQARRDGVHGPQHIASILRKGLEPAPAREGRFLELGCCRRIGLVATGSASVRADRYPPRCTRSLSQGHDQRIF